MIALFKNLQQESSLTLSTYNLTTIATSATVSAAIVKWSSTRMYAPFVMSPYLNSKNAEVRVKMVLL